MDKIYYKGKLTKVVPEINRSSCKGCVFKPTSEEHGDCDFDYHNTQFAEDYTMLCSVRDIIHVLDIKDKKRRYKLKFLNNGKVDN